MMKKNGFTIYELVISFALAFAVLLVIFNTSISLNKKLSELYVKNKITSKQIILNKKLGNDFTNKIISTIEKSADSKTCTITYDDSTSVIVTANNDKDNKYVSINNEKISFDNNIKIDISNIICEKNSAYDNIKIPIKYKGDQIDYGINLYNYRDNTY